MYPFLLEFLILVSGVFYGLTISKYRIFPYFLIKKLFNKLLSKNRFKDTWSIGIYEGDSLSNLKSNKDITNPVLTYKDVTDIDARFVADPFGISTNGQIDMFMEVLNEKTNLGEIGYAHSIDGEKWEYKKIIIKEPFHLSYPYVFESKNKYYLIPESSEDLSVRLYESVDYPKKWKYIGNLISGYPYLDPSIFRYEGHWWLFVSINNNSLNLYHSDNLHEGWKPHPSNPIVKMNGHKARSAGRVIVNGNKIIRLAQDCESYYGKQVFAYEIIKLNELEYEERKFSEKPLISESGKGWNAKGMHHIDIVSMDKKWIALVDGKSK